MKFNTRWAMGLTVLLAILLQQPLAWGQLRTHSGASKSGIGHPKVLEQRVLQLTNEERRKQGLPTLDADAALTTLAREKSDDMINSHYFSKELAESGHVGGRNLKQYDKIEPAMSGWAGKQGENILMGSKEDYSDTETAARHIVDEMMVSPGHRKNILNPAATRVGVGVSIKGKESYVTQEFGGTEKGK